MSIAVFDPQPIADRVRIVWECPACKTREDRGYEWNAANPYDERDVLTP